MATVFKPADIGSDSDQDVLNHVERVGLLQPLLTERPVRLGKAVPGLAILIVAKPHKQARPGVKGLVEHHHAERANEAWGI